CVTRELARLGAEGLRLFGSVDAMQPHFHGFAGAHHADSIPIADAYDLARELLGTGEPWAQDAPQEVRDEGKTHTTLGLRENMAHKVLLLEKEQRDTRALMVERSARFHNRGSPQLALPYRTHYPWHARHILRRPHWLTRAPRLWAREHPRQLRRVAL